MMNTYNTFPRSQLSTLVLMALMSLTTVAQADPQCNGSVQDNICVLSSHIGSDTSFSSYNYQFNNKPVISIGYKAVLGGNSIVLTSDYENLEYPVHSNSGNAFLSGYNGTYAGVKLPGGDGDGSNDHGVFFDGDAKINVILDAVPYGTVLGTLNLDGEYGAGGGKFHLLR